MRSASAHSVARATTPGLVLALSMILLSPVASAQYTPSAGVSVPMEDVETTARDASGENRDGQEREGGTRTQRKVASDSFGNALGNQYDLAVDGAFEGQTITVLQFYTGGGFDFGLPRDAVAEKGFSVYRWSNGAPSPEELAEALEKSTQLWVISGTSRHLNDAHLEVIRAFWEAGHGLYLWGDNPPYIGDANFISRALLDTSMDEARYEQGEQVVSFQRKHGEPGFVPNHLLTTGLEFLYEGHTIPPLTMGPGLEPLIYGSNDILVAAYYDKDGRRAIVDTGFTRLYMNWDTAGTGRYVKNAAAWLANVERHGDAVTAVSARGQ